MSDLKRQYKRYLIEFLVIVLGVSVSFMAEQGRQRINEQFEASDLIDKAMSETKFFLLVDSFKVRYHGRKFIKDIIDEKSIRPDSLHLILEHVVEADIDINEYFPSLFALTKRTDLARDQLDLVKYTSSLIRLYRERDEGNKNLLEQIHTIYFKYGIADDYIRLENVQLEKSKEVREAITWNPLEFNVQYSGRYDLFAQDQEAKNIFKKVYLNLIEQELFIIELKKAKKQAEDLGFN